jgi:LEA14-like dessication related protein
MKVRLILLLLATVLMGCGGITNVRQAPRVSLVAVEPVDFQLFEQRYRVTLRVQNPNDADIGIRGIDYEIAVNDKLFARGVSGKPIELPAYGEALAEVEVVSSLAHLIEQIDDLHRRRESTLRYRISGHVSIDGVPGTVPFEYESTLELPGTGPARGKGESGQTPI